MKLKRELGLLSSVAIGLGAMIGGGIFVLSGVGAGIAGPAVLVAFIIAGILATFNGLSVAELAAKIPKSGATYEYARKLISPSAGFMAGWLFVLSKMLEAATVALAFGGYLSIVNPAMNEVSVAFIISVLLTVVIYFGIKISSEVNNIFVLIKIAALALFVIFGIGFIDFRNFSPFFATDIYSLLQVSALLFFAYTGYARIANLGEEVKNPRKNIPKAISFSLIITSILYILVTAIAIGMVGSKQLGSTNYPISFAASFAHNQFLTAFVTIGAMVATVNVVFGDILSVSRTVFAMARAGDMPRIFSYVDRRNSPFLAVMVAGLVTALLSLAGSIKSLALFTSLTILLYYAIANISASKLKGRDRRYSILVPVFGFLGCIGLALFMPLDVWILTGVAAIAGMAYFKIKNSRI